MDAGADERGHRRRRRAHRRGGADVRENRPGRIAFGVAPTQLGEGASRSALLGRAILRAISGNLDVPGGEPLGNPYDETQYAWHENVGFDRLVDHPLRTRESVNAAETPIVSITGYKAFREAQAKIYPKGHPGCAYMLFASQPAIYRAVVEQDPYPIRAIIVQGGEPLLTMGGAKAAYKAFTSPNLELLVVMDYWLTPTAQLADYVLPAADFLERPDISSHWGIGNFFVVGQKAVEPLFERHNDYELWAGLGGGCSTRPSGRRRSRRCSTASSRRRAGRTRSGRPARRTTLSRGRAGASTRSRASRRRRARSSSCRACWRRSARTRCRSTRARPMRCRTRTSTSTRSR